MRTESAPGGGRRGREPFGAAEKDAAAAASPPAHRAGPPRRRAGAWALRNWRVRARLVALILIPTIAAIVLGGLRASSSFAGAAEYQATRARADLAADVAELAHVLEQERDISVRFVALGRGSQELEALERGRAAVDAMAVSVLQGAAALAKEEQTQRLRGDLARLRNRLVELPVMRKAVTDTRLQAMPTLDMYVRAIEDLLQVYDAVGQGATDEQLVGTVAAFGALARAKDQASRERALLSIAVAARRFGEADLAAFLAARAQRDSELATFRSEASQAERQAYDDIVSGHYRSEYIRDRAIVLTNTGKLLIGADLGGGRGAGWFEAATETVERMRTVEKQLADSVRTRSQELRDVEQQSALIVAGIVLALLVAVLAITVVMARSLVTPLRRLRSEALHIAGKRLPETVRTLRETGDESAAQVEPIGVDSGDEVGEVARAFDEVHREAVRLAGEESKLRANVNAMFVNLSRRSQTLVERQITLIDGLEQGEQDEQRLANLFKLDHLATRMRRNSENLLVLAGQDPPRRWSQPVQLVDVARASLSEVENYERVSLQVPGGVAVVGQAVNDVIHLLAELVENALAFSPRETRVVVSGNGIDGGGVMMSITDSGIGMTQEELVAANERLMDAPTVDVSVSRRMGLFVVARLAHRHDIRVQLRPHGSGGLTAMVLLPESLFGGQAPVFTGSSGMQPEAVPSFGAQGWPGDTGGIAPGWPGGPSGNLPSWPSDLGGSTVPPILSPAPTPGWPSDPGGTFDSEDVWAPAQGPGVSPQRGRLTDTPSWPVHPPAEQNSWPVGDREQSLLRRYDYPDSGSTTTGPIPVVKPATSGDEYLPIFAAVESAWFDRSESGSWGSEKADAGWTAAAAVREPVKGGSTAAGLPKRVPKANLVPGSAETSAPKGVAPMPEISPDRVRSRFASFQQGYRAARGDINDGRYPSGPRSLDSREEGE
ncbi:nitrate- and nitrite sensing domain-containing protein [Nonomuraea sp. NPDC046570]|uniref:sensor histidine kinase n=1 Tax=Nonomuraea sp. NPDC046570 TaxID=3155255 RepID=UPI0033C3D2BD